MQPGQRVIHAHFGYGRVETGGAGAIVAVRLDGGSLSDLPVAELIAVPEAGGDLPKASG